MKRIITLILALLLTLPAHAGWLDAAQSFGRWFLKSNDAKPFALTSLATGITAIALYTTSATTEKQKKRETEKKILAKKQKYKNWGHFFTGATLAALTLGAGYYTYCTANALCKSLRSA